MAVPKPSLQNGVWTGVTGLAGGAGVIFWPNQSWVGYALLTAAEALFLWGLKIDGEHWWKRDKIRATWAYALASLVMFALIIWLVAATRAPLPQDKLAASAVVPTASDVYIEFVPEKIDDSSLEGHFAITNKAREAVTLDVINYRIPGPGAISGEKRDIEIPAGVERVISIWRPNALMASRTILIEYSFRFGGATKAENGSASFDIPAKPTLGVGLKSGPCCKGESKDLRQSVLDQLTFTFQNSPASDSTIDRVPEKTPSGTPLIAQIGSGPKFLQFDMGRRVATFYINRPGEKRKALAVGFPATMDGLHSFRIVWDDVTKKDALFVDGIPAQVEGVGK